MKVYLALLLLLFLTSPAWATSPAPSPSPSSSPSATTTPETEPAFKYRPPASYFAKKALLFPLELPAYIVRGVTYPLHELARVIERTKFDKKAYDYFFKSDVVIYPLIDYSSGNGLAFGMGILARNMYGSGYNLNVNGELYLDLDQRAKLVLSSPDYYIGERPFSYKFITAYRDQTDARFYGVGPDSQKSNKSEYGYNRVHSGFEMDYQVLPDVTLTFPVQFLTIDTKPENDSNTPSVQQIFPPSELTAFQERTTYAVFGLEITHDTRDWKYIPSRGGYQSFRFARFQGLNTDFFSFNEFELDLRKYFRVWTPRHVLVVRNDWVFQQSTGGGGIPFELLTTLDLNSPLRGFPRGRFRDSASVLFNFEYRYPIWDYIDGTLFVDTGKVFSGITNFNFNDWRYSVGGGFRMFFQDYILMRMEAGWGGEGVAFLIRVGEDI